MKYTITALILLPLCLLAGGCGTIANHTDSSWRTQEYGGVKYDCVQIIVNHDSRAISPVSSTCYSIMWIIDLPFSLVCDTLVFPLDFFFLAEDPHSSASDTRSTQPQVSESLETKYFKVRSAIITHIDPANQNNKSDPEKLKKFFWERGVEFPEGSSIRYDKRAGKLYVTNTKENLRRMDFLLRALDDPNLNQIVIESWKAIPQATHDKEPPK